MTANNDQGLARAPLRSSRVDGEKRKKSNKAKIATAQLADVRPAAARNRCAAVPEFAWQRLGTSADLIGTGICRRSPESLDWVMARN